MSIPDEVFDLMASSKFIEAECLLRSHIDESDIGDLYVFSELLIRNQKYNDAISHLTNVIDISITIQDKWYIDVAYLLRSYCYAKTLNKFKSLKDLKKIDTLADVSITWLYSEGRIDPNRILKINSVSS